MDIYNVGLKIKVGFSKKIHMGFRASFKEQMNFFSQLSTTNNDYDRSFYQYKSRIYLENGFIHKAIRFVGNIVSFFVLIFILLKFYSKPNKKVKSDAFFNANNKKLLPQTLLNEFNKIIYLDREKKQYLGKFEKKYILNIWRKYPFSFTFVLKNALKIRYYNYIIASSSVNAIITTSEYSYTSSILTNYCEEKQVLHINVQHGEADKSLSRCYFRFSRCYVWDIYYANLFNEMRADKNQFIIELPPSFTFEDKDVSKETKYKYYLSNETEKEMKTVKKTMDRLGKSYVVRPHPIWTDKKVVDKIFGGKAAENPLEIEIEYSIMSAEVVIARKSTVLFQAYCNGVDTVIDDVTKPQEYCELVEGGYIMVEKDSKLLSEIVGEYRE